MFSKRALDLLKNPKHSENLEENETWSWNFTLDTSTANFLGDKILTLTYTNLSSEESESLFLETLSRVINGKNIDFLTRLSFREVENYLRDENHLPAFDTKEEVSLQNCFKKVKNSLLFALILKKIKENIGTHLQKASWENLSFVDKNRKVMAVLNDLNLLFFQGKRAEVALVENDTIFLIKNDLPLDLEVVELIFQSLFHKNNGKSSLKVVAAL